MTAADRRWRTFAASVRARRLLAALSLVATCAVFAEALAGDAPLLAVGRNGVRALVAVRERNKYATLSRDAIDSLHAGEFVVWPAVRQGPDRISTPRLGVSKLHPLGTDGAGYDVFARLVYGTRSTLVPALFVLLMSSAFGALFGGLAATLGGLWDDVVARPIELVLAFPTVVLIALFGSVFPDRTSLTFMLAVSAVRTAQITRVVRADALRIMTMDHVSASRALGSSWWRVLRRHVWPETAAAVSVMSVTTVSMYVVLEACLAFFGFGLSASWGAMIADGLGPMGSTWAAGCAMAALSVTVTVGASLAFEVARALTPRAPKGGAPAVDEAAT